MLVRTSFALLAVVAILSAGTHVSADTSREEPAAGETSPDPGVEGRAPTVAPAAPVAPDDAGPEASEPPPPRMPVGTTLTFPYEQQRLVRDPSQNGALVYTTAGVARGDTVPVVVFLHGMNAFGLMHMGFAPALDLRLVVDSLVVSGRVAPLVLAAPTHSRKAFAARIMWPDFDLTGFLDATEAALAGAAKLDRSRVVVVGHSGAGCNLTGGLFAEGVRRANPMAVLAVDTCMDERIAGAYASLAAAVPVRFYWQHTWARPITTLEQSCVDCFVEEVVGLPIKTAHTMVLAEAMGRALPEMLPSP